MADHIRLLQCLTCQQIEELPDYEGDPRGDVLLETLVSRHRFPSGTPHLGHLHKVEEKHWNSPSTKRTIIAQINEKSGHTGLDPAYYDTKNTFQLDAAKCFKQHNRNPACSDYKHASKELKPDTAAERKAEGLGRYEVPRDKRMYLCSFCPVHSLVQSAARRRAGLDK